MTANRSHPVRPHPVAKKDFLYSHSYASPNESKFRSQKRSRQKLVHDGPTEPDPSAAAACAEGFSAYSRIGGFKRIRFGHPPGVGRILGWLPTGEWYAALFELAARQRGQSGQRCFAHVGNLFDLTVAIRKCWLR